MIDIKKFVRPFKPNPTPPIGSIISANSNGQAVVEFTLIFVFLLILVWVPVDFGLAFYTGQLALNASREGARIAAADPNLASATCTMPCSSATAETPLKATADRMPNALLPGATITVTYPAGGPLCNEQVRVAVSGTYNYFFYPLFRLMGISVSNTTNMVRQTVMRWEHQKMCL